jgi:topoisomerase-4 subunit A
MIMNREELRDYIEKSYLSYGCMTLSGRSLSYVQDGFKPVHRRILFAMAKLQLSSTSSHKKSARVVGDVIGKYHPHGDTSVYEAMVLMSQAWSIRYPLVDGQGNFGSRDGDSAAAMRYTEARTTPLGDTVLAELNVGAVDYIENYDGTMKEPEFLPAPLPIELLNGSTGIGVGMSADIPSHHIRETADATVAFIRNNKITVDEVMEHLKGPDLPTGGQIINSREVINKAYAEGKGNLHVRARYEIEQLARGQWRIIITELPHDMSCKHVLTKVAEASIYEPPKDKKSGKTQKPNQSMVELKQFIKSSIEDISDITTSEDPEGSTRLLIEPKSSRQDPDEFMNNVIKMLGLQSTLKFNLTAVSNDRRPKRRTILNIISDWVDFRRITVTKRTETRLGKIINRLELVNGRLTIMDVIDEVIEIIRTEDNPEAELMARFGLTERQAEDVMSIRLRELRKLEEFKLQEEKDRLLKEKTGLEDLLASVRKMNNLMIREINETADKYNDKRKTLIEESDLIIKGTASVIPSDPITLWMTKDNWLVARKGYAEEGEAPDNALKPGDKYVKHIQSKLDKTLIMLGESGRAYSIQASTLSFGRGNGVHLNTLITLNGDHIKWIDTYEPDTQYLLTQDAGYGFITKSDDFITRQKAGKEFFKLDKFPNACISAVIPLSEGVMVNVWTDQKRFLQFPVSEINYYPKSQGMRLVNLAPDETAEGYALSPEGEFAYKGRRKNLDSSYTKKRSAAPKKL